MTMRLTYEFTLAGRTFKAINAVIGETIDSEWFVNDDKLWSKWSAIHHSLPLLYETIEEEWSDVNEVNPEQFGIVFQTLEQGE